jgi:hypothetical protein
MEISWSQKVVVVSFVFCVIINDFWPQKPLGAQSCFRFLHHSNFLVYHDSCLKLTDRRFPFSFHPGWLVNQFRISRISSGNKILSCSVFEPAGDFNKCVYILNWSIVKWYLGFFQEISSLLFNNLLRPLWLDIFSKNKPDTLLIFLHAFLIIVICGQTMTSWLVGYLIAAGKC